VGPGAWVFVGLGANQAQPRRTLDAAQQALRLLPGVRDFRASSLYLTSPVDAIGPDFLNAVACFETPLAPHALLAVLHDIEHRFGRERPYRNAPRTLDLDLLLYGAKAPDGGAADGGRMIAGRALVVPHPRAHERAFVLEPLAELWPEAIIPGHGPIGPLREAVRERGGQRIERLPPMC
jgi:2-amino-4-hydroxy-6-hydroxymethyldihydropteridine diphosphokinase